MSSANLVKDISDFHKSEGILKGAEVSHSWQQHRTKSFVFCRQQNPSSSPMGTTGRRPGFEWGRISDLVNSSGGQSRKVKGKAKRKRIELSYLFRSPAHKVEITALMEASCADTFFNATHG